MWTRATSPVKSCGAGIVGTAPFAPQNPLVHFQVVHCTTDTGTVSPNPGNSSLMNTIKSGLGVVGILVCLGATALAQQKGTSVGPVSGSAIRASKATVAAPKLETSSLSVTCDSVANVMITDPQGRRLGDDPKAHAHYDEIPNAYYEGGGLDDDETGEAEDDPAKLLFIPTPVAGEFKVAVFLEKAGEYSCDLVGYDNGGNTSKVALNEVPGKEGDVQKFTLSFSGAPGSKIKMVSAPASSRTP